MPFLHTMSLAVEIDMIQWVTHTHTHTHSQSQRCHLAHYFNFFTANAPKKHHLASNNRKITYVQEANIFINFHQHTPTVNVLARMICVILFCVSWQFHLQRKQNHICSPTRYTKSINEWVYSSSMLARHVSDLIGPSSGAFYKLHFQIWYVL